MLAWSYHCEVEPALVKVQLLGDEGWELCAIEHIPPNASKYWFKKSTGEKCCR